MSKKLRLGDHSTNGHSSRFNIDELSIGTRRKRPGLPTVKAMTPNQAAYMEAIKDNRLVFCLGPAGTGKTHVAAGVAARELHASNIKQIIGVRPTVECGDRHLGATPGDLDEKLHPFLKPLLNELRQFFDPEEFRKMRTGEFPVIELSTLQHMRGSTFKDCIVIMDEAQNCTHREMEMFLTRLGFGSTLIINGDTSRDRDGRMRQCDLHSSEQGALEYFAKATDGFDNEVSVITMTTQDCVRDPFLKRLMQHLEM